MSCVWCEGEGCDECQSSAKPQKETPSACPWCEGEGCDECGKKKQCEWCDGEGCDECRKKTAKCDFCDGAGCEQCEKSGPGPGPKQCDFCDGSGCDQCRDTDLKFDVILINLFCEAEEERSENPNKALEKFRKIVELAKEHTSKGETLDDELHSTVFKSLQHIVIILLHLKLEKEALQAHKDLLAYFPQVSQNESDNAIDVILGDSNTTGSGHESLREEMYDITLSTLSKMSDRGNMLFTIQMRRCTEYVAKARYKEAKKLLEKIHDRCRLPDGRDDQKNKGSELIEIYALELKIASNTRNQQLLKALYEKTKDLTASVKNPKSQSVIRECWGKMFGSLGNWQRAYTEFYNAFTSFQEAGDPDGAKRSLKYTVVANMLAKGEHNPFAAREARVYQNDTEITPIINLRAAYDKRDVAAFGKCLDAFYQTADDFIRGHMDNTVAEFQRLAALKILKSYRRIKLIELASKLQTSVEKTEELLVQLILDGKLNGRIDQVKGWLDLSQRGAADGDKFNAIEHWTTTLDGLSKSIPQPHAGRGPPMGW